MEKTIHDYPNLDLSILLEPEKKLAVRFTSEDEAVWFLAAMKVQYPEKCENWTFPSSRWYGGDSIDYFPYLNNCDGTRMMCASGNWAEENNYTVIPFEMLTGEFDKGEIVQSDISLDALFGL